MSYSQKNGARMKNCTVTFISESDIWKERVMLDAIKSERKVKVRFSKFF
jgi:hypothetical protein